MGMTRWMAAAVAMVVVLGASASAPGQTKKTSKSAGDAAGSSGGERKLYTFSTASYRITTDLDKPLAQEIGKHMDAVFREYTSKFRDFGGRVSTAHPLYIFSTREGYLKMLAERGIDGSGSGGMFFGGDSLATFLGEQGLERMYHTLQHEGFHQFAHHRLGRDLPQWVNEGLAEYFGEAIMVKGQLRPGQVPVEKLAMLKQAIEKNQTIPFRKLVYMSNAEWNANVRGGDASMQYDQSWAMCHFLVHGDARYKGAFAAYLKLISTGQESDAAFAKAFGSTDTKPFEDAWVKFMTKLEPNPEKTAAKRLQFLASGMRWLKGQNETFSSLEELQQKLQARSYGVRYSNGAGGVLQISSKDEENFKAPPAAAPTGAAAMKKNAVTPTLEWVTPAEEGAMPGLMVKGLALTVKLIWTKDADTGKDVAKIVYE